VVVYLFELSQLVFRPTQLVTKNWKIYLKN
jgi:hypothetical protein